MSARLGPTPDLVQREIRSIWAGLSRQPPSSACSFEIAYQRSPPSSPHGEASRGVQLWAPDGEFPCAKFCFASRFRQPKPMRLGQAGWRLASGYLLRTLNHVRATYGHVLLGGPPIGAPPFYRNTAILGSHPPKNRHTPIAWAQVHFPLWKTSSCAGLAGIPAAQRRPHTALYRLPGEAIENSEQLFGTFEMLIHRFVLLEVRVFVSSFIFSTTTTQSKAFIQRPQCVAASWG